MTEPFYVDLWNDVVFHITNDFKPPHTLDDTKPWLWLLTTFCSAVAFVWWAVPRIRIGGSITRTTAWRLPAEIRASKKLARELEIAIVLLRTPDAIPTHLVSTIGFMVARVGLALAAMIAGAIIGLFPANIVLWVVGLVMLTAAVNRLVSEIRAMKFATESTTEDIAAQEKSAAEFLRTVEVRKGLKVHWTMNWQIKRTIPPMERIVALHRILINQVRANRGLPPSTYDSSVT